MEGRILKYSQRLDDRSDNATGNVQRGNCLKASVFYPKESDRGVTESHINGKVGEWHGNFVVALGKGRQWF